MLLVHPNSTTETPTAAQLDELAHEIAALGIHVHEGHVAAVAEAAARRGATPALVAMVRNQDAPSVVRERAFGRLAAQLAARLAAAPDRDLDDRLCA